MISNWLLQKTAGNDYISFFGIQESFSALSFFFFLQINNQLHIFFWFLGNRPSDFPLHDQTFFTLKAKDKIGSQISPRKGFKSTCTFCSFQTFVIATKIISRYNPFTTVLINFVCQLGYIMVLKYLVKLQSRCHYEGFFCFCFKAGITI